MRTLGARGRLQGRGKFGQAAPRRHGGGGPDGGGAQGRPRHSEASEHGKHRPPPTMGGMRREGPPRPRRRPGTPAKGAQGRPQRPQESHVRREPFKPALPQPAPEQCPQGRPPAPRRDQTRTVRKAIHRSAPHGWGRQAPRPAAETIKATDNAKAAPAQGERGGGGKTKSQSGSASTQRATRGPIETPERYQTET